MNQHHRILIADDHPLILSGLKNQIDRRSDCQLVYQARSGEEAWNAIQTHKPTIVILDIQMGSPNGLEIAGRLNEDENAVSVILLTMYRDLSFVHQARLYNVKGYLLKDHVIEELNVCLDAVMNGEDYLSRILQTLEKELESSDPVMSKLTRMERKVFRLIGEGKTNKEIAELLYLSPKTVDNHRYNMTRKLDLKGNNALLIMAVNVFNAAGQ